MPRRSPSDEHRIDLLRRLPLEPMDYCQRWVSRSPSRGYRKACINALVDATGLSPGTIRNWGTDFQRRPLYVLRILRQADLLNQLRELDRADLINLSGDRLRE
jgi:hypothetical protein